MDRLESILVAVDRNAGARSALAKALMLASHFGARLELFLCDAERAYALKHQPESRSVGEMRQECLMSSRRYLEDLRASFGGDAMRISIDVMCESPLYEGIVHKSQQSCPGLVIRSIGGSESAGAAGLSATDWALVRTCPVPLLLTRGRSWQHPTQIAAAVDISNDESQELMREILQTAAFLKAGCGGTLEVLYGGGDAGAAALDTGKALLEGRVAQAQVQAEQIRVLGGDPATTLSGYATRRDYDVLVMGALTHHKALSELVGTLTGKLLDKLKCDFLLVKPSTFVCPVRNGPAAGSA